MSFLRVENLSQNFGGLHALDNVNFDVRQGEIFTIIGPNGAGKSTIFNLISRLYDPTEGHIFFNDQDIKNYAPHDIVRLGIARTFQNIELFENTSVLENMLLGRYIHCGANLMQNILFTPGQRREEKSHYAHVEDVMDFLRLASWRDKRIAELPYGVRKVVELGRALAAQPRLILLDEPSSGLNPEETLDMSFWIRDIRDLLEITVIIIEHDMNLVHSVSDRVVAINRGRTIICGRPDEVQAHPEVARAYLGDAL